MPRGLCTHWFLCLQCSSLRAPLTYTQIPATHKIANVHHQLLAQQHCHTEVFSTTKVSLSPCDMFLKHPILFLLFFSFNPCLCKCDFVDGHDKRWNLHNGLGYGICFSQWRINEHNTGRGLKGGVGTCSLTVTGPPRLPSQTSLLHAGRSHTEEQRFPVPPCPLTDHRHKRELSTDQGSWPVGPAQ